MRIKNKARGNRKIYLLPHKAEELDRNQKPGPSMKVISTSPSESSLTLTSPIGKEGDEHPEAAINSSPSKFSQPYPKAAVALDPRTSSSPHVNQSGNSLLSTAKAKSRTYREVKVSPTSAARCRYCERRRKRKGQKKGGDPSVLRRR